MKEKAKTESEALLKRLKDGEKLADIAKAAGVQVQESGLLSKAGQQQSPFPNELVNQAFALSAAVQIPDQPGQVDDNYYIYCYQTRKAADLTGKEETLKQYEESLHRYKQQEILTEFLDQQRKTAKITRSKSL